VALGDGARLVLVTSASHMPRAMAYSRRAGLEPVAAPTHRLSGRSAYDELRDWLPAADHLQNVVITDARTKPCHSPCA